MSIDPQSDEAIDRRIAEMMGFPFSRPTHGPCCTCQTCGWDFDTCQCGYAEDIEKAWQVVGWMLKRGWEVELKSQECGKRWRACVVEGIWGVNWQKRLAYLYAPTAPRAICKAALGALETVGNDYAIP